MSAVTRILVAGAIGACLSTQAHALAVYGLTSASALVRFDSATPGVVNSTVAITGLGGATLLGIDFRPANGQLFGVASNSRLYTIDPLTGVATTVGSAGSFVLSGSSFGFDFNPTVDRIRLVGNTGQDLRLNPNDGTIAATDPALAFAATDANAGATPRIVGAAYTNSFAGATTTTLYDIDSNLDILAIQNPPNNGILNTVGALGINASDNVGFDIFFFNNQAFASLTTPTGASGFYSINLGTGAATLIGSFAAGLGITDIAIVQVPEPWTGALLGAGLLGLALQARRRRR